ncbi:MAG: RDD family protein [Chitinophagaceae bacterium]|nr:RDD family protein [Anaerolineae bacterium]
MESSQSYELADIGERFIALVIDSIIVGIIGGVFGASGNWWGGGLVGFLIGAVYQWYFLTQQNGQTLGKKVMNIRVIKTDGGPIRDADAVLRFIGYYINSVIIGIGWIWALFDKENRGWHDLIANTYVIKASSANNVIIDEKRKNTI